MESNQQQQPNLRSEYSYSDGSGAPEVPKPKLASSYKLQREDNQKKNNHETISKQTLPQEGNEHNGEFLLKPGYSKNSKGSKNLCHICGCKFIHTTHLLGSFCKKGNLHLNVSNARIIFSNLKHHRI